MEEAEALCQRIAIMAKGYLRCIGTQVHLKKIYGKGFKITVCCDPHKHQEAIK
jgi:ABC-type multidrug transport system ATPase subunit